MTEAEKKLISDRLPKGFDWALVQYTKMGNFAQVLYNNDLVGYIMHDVDQLYFKDKGAWKG